jgi:hypothetical protein
MVKVCTMGFAWKDLHLQSMERQLLNALTERVNLSAKKKA